MIVTKNLGLFSEQEWIRLREHLNLPTRQAEILKCIMGGMSDKQVAAATGISVNTVRTHMTRLFRKFDSNDRVELIICVLGYLREYKLQDSHTLALETVASEAACPPVRRNRR